MTQIGRYIAPTRRPNALGVHSMDCFNMAVPDLEEARRFYTKFGLDAREEQGGLGLYTFDHPHRWGLLSEGPRKALGHLSFGIFEDDLQRFRARLQQAGGERLDPPPGFESNGIWFKDCNGLPVELRVAEKSSPSAKSTVEQPSVGPGRRGAPLRGATPEVRPRRLAHVLVFVRDVAESIRFYSQMLGMRLSDESGGVIAFMHGIHGSDHHMVAFAKSSAPGLHHCSWDVASIQDIGLGAMHMADSGFSKGWPRAARARLQLLPLRARSLGQLQRVFLRHRLHPGRDGLEWRVPPHGEQLLSLGSGTAAGLRLQPRGCGRAATPRRRHGLNPSSRGPTGRASLLAGPAGPGGRTT